MSDKQTKRRILVTGGAGFIASHVADAYLEAGHDVWIVDDLSSGRTENIPTDAKFVEMDVRDPGIRDLFREVRFDLVNHHAAQIDVRVSVTDPAKDASINLLGLLNLTEAAIEVGTQRVVFVSSGGVVYGEPEQIPTPETAPKLPLSPYGVTKLGGEFYLNYYRKIRGLRAPPGSPRGGGSRGHLLQPTPGRSGTHRVRRRRTNA
jgi:UDP-glucose 4-epimerase